MHVTDGECLYCLRCYSIKLKGSEYPNLMLAVCKLIRTTKENIKCSCCGVTISLISKLELENAAEELLETTQYV